MTLFKTNRDFVSYVNMFSRIYLTLPPKEQKNQSIDFDHFFSLNLHTGYMVLK